MYIDYTKFAPKDFIPVFIIDRLFDNSPNYKVLCFMHSYSCYNQTPICCGWDQIKIVFIMDKKCTWTNIIAKTSIKKNHVEDLEKKMLNRLGQYSMSLNLFKCSFGVSLVHFLDIYV
ncbi:hypothetical protein CR513_51645, partial [Mucuna pruriens]